MQIWLPNVAEFKTWCWPHRSLLVRLGEATETFRTSDGRQLFCPMACIPQGVLFAMPSKDPLKYLETSIL